MKDEKHGCEPKLGAPYTARLGSPDDSIDKNNLEDMVRHRDGLLVFLQEHLYGFEEEEEIAAVIERARILGVVIERMYDEWGRRGETLDPEASWKG